MSDWRDRIAANPAALQELSADTMAATRIMRGLGASVKDIGRMCSRFGIAYNESETSFQRAVSIFREVYSEARLIDFMDVKTGNHYDDLFDSLVEDKRTGIVFYRIKGQSGMTAFVKGLHLMVSPLGNIVLKPGMKYVLCKNDMQIWEQDPITLIKSFSKIKTGD